jgi:hypothetical protein
VTTREITHEAVRLPERERDIVIGIVWQCGEACWAPPQKEADAAF